MIFPFQPKSNQKMRASLFRQKLKVFPDFFSQKCNLCMLVMYTSSCNILGPVDLCNLYFSFRHSSWFIFPDLFFQYFENMADNIFSRFPVQLALLQRGNNRRGWKEKNNPSAKVRIVMITIFTMMIRDAVIYVLAEFVR